MNFARTTPFANIALFTAIVLAVNYLAVVPTVYADAIAVETFESYSAGSNLNGGNGGSGWSSAWTTTGNHVTVQTITLQQGFNNGSSQAARIQPTANIVNDNSIMTRSFPATGGNAVYLGFLLRLESFEDGDFLQIQLSNGDVGNDANTLSVGVNQTAGNPFFARVGQSGNTDNSAVSALDNTDYFLVAKFSMDGSPFFNRTDLFLNPTSLNESTQIPIATQIGPSSGLTQLSLFNVRSFSHETDDRVFLDNIRVGTSFEAVVTPEPSSLIIFGILTAGAAGYFGARRRRKTV